jgi:type I restriction enzyme R subunit
MWLTGFDVPPLHTMYIDKPMQGHGLMQAIARVNRVYKDKPGGLIVDYLGLAYHLQKALGTYTESGHPAEIPDQEKAVNELLKRYEICKGLFHGFDWSKFFTGTAVEKTNILPQAMEHSLKLDEGKKRLLQSVRELSLAFALAVPNERALAIRDDVSFFQAVRAALLKSTVDGERDAEDIDQAIRQILSRAVSASDQVVDIFAAAGLKKPEISILSEEFLADVKGMPQRNLAIELLRKLLNDELKSRMKKNVVQSRSFTELLEKTIRSYQNRTLDSAEVIAELIKLAEEMREAQKRGEKLNLTEDEIAFYDALEVNDSAVQELGDDTLKTIARELVETVRKNTTIDWTVRETVRAKLRVMVKRILRKYGYPPDKQEQATITVLEQAEVIAKDWAG